MIDLKNNPRDDKVMSQKEKNSLRRWIMITLIIFSLLGLVLIIGLAYGYDSPVGVVDLNNSMVLGWNQGMIANETYFNKSSGFLQLANALNRTGDVTYFYGFARKSGSSYTYFGVRSLPGDLSWNTDFMTYYYTQALKNVTYLTNQFSILKNNSQGVNDNMVRIDWAFTSSRNVSGENYFVESLINIDVGRDRKSETFILWQANGSMIWLWGIENKTALYDNVTKIVINGASYAYYLEYLVPRMVIYNRSVGQNVINGDLNIVSYMGNIRDRGSWNVTTFWIDADTCTTTSPTNCVLSADVNLTDLIGNAIDLSLVQSQNRGISCIWRESGLGCPLNTTKYSSFTNGCYLLWIQNYTSNATLAEIGHEQNSSLNCYDSYCAKHLNNQTNKSAWYNETIVAKTPSTANFYCGVGTNGTGINFRSGVRGIEVNQTKDRNITLSLPVNQTNLTTSLNWVVLSCNWTVYGLDNLTLYINNTANYTEGYTRGGSNLSRNVSFTGNGIWEWTCRGCTVGNNCSWAWNGNRTISIQSTSIIVSIQNFNKQLLLFIENIKKRYCELHLFGVICLDK